MVVAVVVFIVVLRVVERSVAHFENMRTNMKRLISSFDLSGLLLSLSGILLGVLLASADYHVKWEAASALILTTLPLHVYMLRSGRWWLAASVIGAVLTVYLSYGTIFCLESLLLLLFGYFILRLAKGFGGKGRFADTMVTVFLKGLVAVFGAYFVCTHSFPFWFLLFPAFSLGLLGAAADLTEYKSGKGLITVLLLLGLALMMVFSLLRVFSLAHFLYLLAIPAYLYIIYSMYTRKEQDPSLYRPFLALCTFAVAVLTGVGFVGYLL